MPPHRVESYAEVLRWHDSTEINYTLNAKKDRIKPFNRYKRYAGAKTVAQALELGSKPLDLVEDFETGILKRVGGPYRDDPLDILAMEDNTSLTETDPILSRCFGRYLQSLKSKASYAKWKKASLSAKFGVNVEDMDLSEWPAMAAARSRANVEAQNILEQTEVEGGRKITDEEVLRVLRLWAIKRNRGRRNTMPTGMSWVHCEVVGLNSTRGNFATRHTREYPKVMTLLVQWLKDNGAQGENGHIEDVPFTSIIINSAYAARRHRDCRNTGPTVVKAFGEFEDGGKLRYWKDDDTATGIEILEGVDPVELDVRSKARLIDGKRSHEVSSFTGERFSLVYFTSEGYDKVTDDVKEQLVSVGFPFPDSEQLASAREHLPTAKGYGLAAGLGHRPQQRKEITKKKKVGPLFARMMLMAKSKASSDDADPASNKLSKSFTDGGLLNRMALARGVGSGLAAPKRPLAPGGLRARVQAKRALERQSSREQEFEEQLYQVTQASKAKNAKEDAKDKTGGGSKALEESLKRARVDSGNIDKSKGKPARTTKSELPTSTPAMFAKHSKPRNQESEEFDAFAITLSSAVGDQGVSAVAAFLHGIATGSNQAEELLAAAMTVMAPPHEVPSKGLAQAISEAFGGPVIPGLSGDGLVARALGGWQKRPAPSQSSPLTITKVADCINLCASAGDELPNTTIKSLAKLLSSAAGAMEIFLLVRCLQGKLGPWSLRRI